MDTLAKLGAIEQAAHIYEICYRNAGVGFCFYEGPYDAEGHIPRDWRQHLVTHNYYPTIHEAIAAEFQRLGLDKDSAIG